MIEYAKGLGASEEVLNWCNTTLASHKKKNPDTTREEMEHVLDYLMSDYAPSRLRRMSYAQAKDAAEKWSAANQKRGRHLVDGPDDLHTIHDFGDGSRVVQLLTEKAYFREGFFMSHCVGGYNPKTTTIYSYRDAENIPHATFEVTRDGGEIQQIKGKGNGPIHPKYINPILTFLTSIGKRPRPEEMIHLGYQHITPDYYTILKRFTLPNGDSIPTYSLYGDIYAVV